MMRILKKGKTALADTWNNLHRQRIPSEIKQNVTTNAMWRESPWWSGRGPRAEPPIG